MDNLNGIVKCLKTIKLFYVKDSLEAEKMTELILKDVIIDMNAEDSLAKTMLCIIS